MRNHDPIIYSKSSLENDLKMQRNQNYDDSINILQTQWYQADLDQRFALGDAELWNTLFPQIGKQRNTFNFNLINNTIQMVSGYQRKNRKSIVSIPIKEGMQKTADQFTKCLYHIHSSPYAYQTYSDAFEQGALTQGNGLIGIYLDYSNDPVSGEIKTRYIDFKSVIIDPFFRKPDLSDCRFIWTRQFFDKIELMMLYPKLADRIEEIPLGKYNDQKFYFMPEANQIQFKYMLAFDEYWYLSTREATFLLDTQTEEVQEVTGQEEQIKKAMFKFGNRLRVIKQPKQTVRRSLWINENLIEDKENPYEIDCYPFVTTLAYFTPDTQYYQYKFKGIVRDMRDAQFLFNRRKVADLDIIESQQQGLKIKKGALVKPDDALNTGHGRALFIDPKFSLDDVQQMQIIPPAPTMIQMEEMLRDVMQKISGVNEELLGSAIDDKAGILSMLRQGAGLTTLQRLFDQFDECQKQIGNIMIQIIQKKWTYNKVKQIIGEEPSQEFRDKAFFNYGTKVVQGVLTESQQQLEFQQLLYLYELSGSKNQIMLDRAIEVSTIQNKDKLLEQMQQQAQAEQQQAQKMQEIQMAQIQTDIQTKLSYANSQDGLAAERMAKIQTDKAVAEDKLSRAEQEDTASLLNLVKTIKELQSFDQENIMKKIQTLSMIKDIEFDKKQEMRQEESATNQPQNF